VAHHHSGEETIMTQAQAQQYVLDHEDDDPMDDDDLEEVYTALYGQPPDAQDREDGVWSLCCAAVER